MKASHILFLFLLPSLITGLKSSFPSYDFDKLSFVFKGMYMFQKEDSPYVKVDGVSRINFNYTAVNVKPNKDSSMQMDVVILSEKAFEEMGYKDSANKRVLCCDSNAVQKGLCTNQGHILLPKDMEDEYTVQTVTLKEHENKGSVSFNVKRTGVYFVVAISCDYRIGTVHFEGSYETINPFGQLPAPLYGSLPFTGVLLVGYIVLLAVWLVLCAKYAQEIMSVHIIILVVLACFVVDMLVKLIYLFFFNAFGTPTFLLAIASIVVDCSTRTLTRVLTLFVCMGLGVTKANLDDSLITVKFLLFGIAYYLITFADSYLAIYPTTNKVVEGVRFVLTSSIDAIVYFWIFISLMDTMDALREQKQEMKLAIYTKLRNLFIISVLVATVTLVGFSYVVLNDLAGKVWKYQWFINDGIWGLFYFFLFVSIMIMWRPSENTSEYAYHIQIATGEQENEENYGPANDSLVDMENEGSHVVVGDVSSEMKPMQLVELVQEQK
ncbi:hypothetical protein WA556_003788 [Blastocystis sp. ATCC 50177/Nand II]